MNHRFLCAFLLFAAVQVHAQPCAFSTTEVGKVVQNCGNVGVGTLQPEVDLHVVDNSTGVATFKMTGSSTSEIVLSGSTAEGGTGLRIVGGYGHFKLGIGTAGSGSGRFTIADFAGFPGQIRFVIDPSGNVGIGTSSPSSKFHVVGNSTFTGDASFTGTVSGGSIQASYQDVAEWVPSVEDLVPGTVVVLDPLIDNTVVKSTRAYDTTVAGVVSAQPGIILGHGGAAKEQIATTGRVRVKVDARAASIRIGDLLVTSDRPGMAMKSLPIEIGSAVIHRPGTIVGKALEPIADGEGEILVLLSLQ